jgi:hypothetical protein
MVEEPARVLGGSFFKTVLFFNDVGHIR